MDKLISQMAGIVGTDHVIECPPEALPASWQRTLAVSVSPATVAEIEAVVRTVSDTCPGTGIVPVGGGLQLSAGYPPESKAATVLLSLHRLNRITDHQQDDMTITMEPGVTIAAADALLKGSRQMLALDVPRPELATIGGTTASAAHPLRRFKYGAVRDTLIGLNAVLPEGVVVKGGGKVVKNVAGYDVCKLFTGSYGSVGVLSELTYRIQPLPEVRSTVAWTTTSAAQASVAGIALHQARLAHTFLLVSSSASNAYTLYIGFDGIEKRVKWQEERAAEVVREAGLHTDLEHISAEDALTLQNAPHDCMERCEAAGRLSLLVTNIPGAMSSLEALNPAFLSADISCGIIQTAFSTLTDATAKQVMTTVDNAGEDANMIWHLLEPNVPAIPRWGAQRPALRLSRSLKAAIDPQNLFSPGRFPGRA